MVEMQKGIRIIRLLKVKKQVLLSKLKQALHTPLKFS